MQISGSAFAVADRGGATRGLRRGGRQVAVLRRPPTARAGWRRSRPGRGCSTFLPVQAGMGPRPRRGFLQRAVAAIAIRYGCLRRQVACRVAVGRFGWRCRVGVALWVAGRWGRPGWRRATPVYRRSTLPALKHEAGPPRPVIHRRRRHGPGRRAQQQAAIAPSGMVPSPGRRPAGGECQPATPAAPPPATSFISWIRESMTAA